MKKTDLSKKTLLLSYLVAALMALSACGKSGEGEPSEIIEAPGTEQEAEAVDAFPGPQPMAEQVDSGEMVQAQQTDTEQSQIAAPEAGDAEAAQSGAAPETQVRVEDPAASTSTTNSGAAQAEGSDASSNASSANESNQSGSSADISVDPVVAPETQAPVTLPETSAQEESTSPGQQTVVNQSSGNSFQECKQRTDVPFFTCYILQNPVEEWMTPAGKRWSQYDSVQDPVFTRAVGYGDHNEGQWFTDAGYDNLMVMLQDKVNQNFAEREAHHSKALAAQIFNIQMQKPRHYPDITISFSRNPRDGSPVKNYQFKGEFEWLANDGFNLYSAQPGTSHYLQAKMQAVQSSPQDLDLTLHCMDLENVDRTCRIAVMVFASKENPNVKAYAVHRTMKVNFHLEANYRQAELNPNLSYWYQAFNNNVRFYSGEEDSQDLYPRLSTISFKTVAMAFGESRYNIEMKIIEDIDTKLEHVINMQGQLVRWSSENRAEQAVEKFETFLQTQSEGQQPITSTRDIGRFSADLLRPVLANNNGRGVLRFRLTYENDERVWFTLFAHHTVLDLSRLEHK